MKIGLAVPTFNAGDSWLAWLNAVDEQTRAPERRLIVDSTSSDETVQLAKDKGWETLVIPQHEFDHGGTRQKVIEMMDDMDIVVFLTQDAILANEQSIAHLVKGFDFNPKLGSVYGRQLPHHDATDAAKRLRQFNYPDKSAKFDENDLNRIGIRAAFASNSFSAYRVESIQSIGGFEKKLIFGEDMQAVLRLLKAGYEHAYIADASVFHSHNYTYVQEMRRYFDMGVFHQTQSQLLSSYKGPGGEAKKLIKTEMLRLIRSKNLYGSIDFLLRNAARALGYGMSKCYTLLPLSLVLMVTMNKFFWLNKNSSQS